MNTRRTGAVLALVGFGLALSACGSSGLNNEVGAYRACERAVETQLRAPATADFSGYSNSTINASGRTYSVAGYVDAENGFGANIRTNWTCTVSGDADQWDLVDLDVS